MPWGVKNPDLKNDPRYLEPKVNQLESDLADIMTLANKSDSSTDDTALLQNAINSSSTGNGLVKLQKNKIYIVGSLVPKENVIIDLNGSTLKLKNNTQLPVFYDGGTTKPTKYKNFGVINGTIDANMQNNQAVNQSAGVFWLTDWDGLLFDKLKIINAFRNIFNLWGCHNIKIPNVLCENNGVNVGGYYSYGAAFENGCKNIDIGNFIVKNMFGFGIHFNNVEAYKADNLTFDTFTHGSAIAITFTQSKRGKVNNIICKNVLGDNIEINACTDLEINNINIDSAGNRPILFGDNNTGIYNERIKINNAVTTNTVGAESLSINYLKYGEFNKCNFDKTLTTLAILTTENCRFIDCSFGTVMPSLAVYYNKFKFINTKFSDILIQRLENTLGECCNLGVGILVNDGASINIPIAKLEKSDSGALGGRLCVTSTFTDNFGQVTYQEHAFVFYGSILNKVELASVDGSFGRKITVTVDTTNKQFILTNSTGAQLVVKWTLYFQ